MDAQNINDLPMRRFHRKPNFWTKSAPQRFVLPRDFLRKLGRWAVKQITPASELILLLAVSVAVYIWPEVKREVLIIDPFTVPKRYKEAGLTPDVMANWVGDAMREIEYETQTSMNKDALARGRDEESIPDVQIPETKFGLRAIIDLTRGVFAIYPKRVSEDIVWPVRPAEADSAPVKARATIYISEGRNRGPKIPLGCPAEDIDGLLQQTAEVVLRQINPYILASHAEERHEYKKSLEIVQAVLQEASQDRRHMAAAMNLWGIALYDQKKYDEGVVKYRKAFEIDSKSAYPYYGWGAALRDQEKFDEAIVQFQKAIEVDPKSVHAYHNLGVALRHVGKGAEAGTKFKRAQELLNSRRARVFEGSVLCAERGGNE